MGAGVLAAGAGSYHVLKSLSSPEEVKKLKVDLTRTPTYCEVCFWKCAGWVYKTSEGNIWKIVGSLNDGYPFISWQFDFSLTDYSGLRPYYYNGTEFKKTYAYTYYDGSAFKYPVRKYYNGSEWIY